MASNTPSRHQDASGAMAAAGTQPDHISLRIITLAHGSDREGELYLVLNITTKVGELKESLQQHLGQHPRPDHQRLIYQGRPLLDNNATLQSILRLDPSTNPPPVHVLHLVIREQQAFSTHPAVTASPQAAQTTQTASTAPTAPTGAHSHNAPPAPQPGQIPLPPNLFQPVLPGMAAAQQMIQNQMNAIQQHMAMHNQHLANAHPGLPQPHLRGTLPFQGNPGVGLGIGPPGAQVRTIPGTPNSETRPGTPGGAPLVHGLPQVMQTGMTTRVQETIGPNGERIRTVINTRVPFPPNHLTPPQSNPVERSASAPGVSPRPSTPLPTVTTAGPDIAGTIPHFQPPPLPIMPSHFARTTVHPFSVQQLGQPRLPQANPTVYLLSSSAGPQALVFAPGHGYFSTQTSAQLTSNEASQPASTSTQPAQVTPNQPPTQGMPANNDANPVRADMILRPAQGQNQPPVVARPQRREAEDLLAFFLQRGWLFMRLYMFIYVLSEAGTWRRMILLSIAVFVCLLPRQNPLTDAFNVVRRHFDNLIGPPQAPPRRQTPAQQPGHHQNADGGPDQPATPANEAARRSQNMPTPEEHARRLLREHRTQNPSFVRGILHSVEQAVALFLASLIPGVGERHVRAREEARRIVQEEDRRRREAEASNTQPTTEQQMPSQPGLSTEASGDTDQGSGDSKGQDVSIGSSNINEAQRAEGRSTGIDPSPTVSSTPPADSADAEGVRRRIDASPASSSG